MVWTSTLRLLIHSQEWTLYIAETIPIVLSSTLSGQHGACLRESLNTSLAGRTIRALKIILQIGDSRIYWRITVCQKNAGPPSRVDYQWRRRRWTVKLLSVILVKTFNKSRSLKFLATHTKSAEKLDPFALYSELFNIKTSLTDCLRYYTLHRQMKCGWSVDGQYRFVSCRLWRNYRIHRWLRVVTQACLCDLTISQNRGCDSEPHKKIIPHQNLEAFFELAIVRDSQSHL
jgi:hypothetical protein